MTKDIIALSAVGAALYLLLKSNTPNKTKQVYIKKIPRSQLNLQYGKLPSFSKDTLFTKTRKPTLNSVSTKFDKPSFDYEFKTPSFQ